MTIKDLPDTKNIRELLAITRPEVGWPMVAMDALVDITTICDLIEGGGLIRPDLAPQAGSVDVERLKRKVPKMPSGRLARACELNAINNAKVWNSCIDHLASRNLLNPGPQGSVDVEAVIDAVTSFYTRKEDRNFAAQVARNTLDNLLAGAPVGGDRPAIPGLQEAIELIAACKNLGLGHSNKIDNPYVLFHPSSEKGEVSRVWKGDKDGYVDSKVTFDAIDRFKKALEAYEAARQSGVPEGYVCVPIEPTEAMCDAGMNAKDVLGERTSRIKYRAMIAAARDGRD